MPKPNLTFFCELGPEALVKLFDGRFVIDDLLHLHATLSLGIIDFSKERAKVIQRLNKAGVPVVAWLLLPEVQGYWFNIDNHRAAAARVVEFKAWTSRHNLQWAGVGLDVEMDINDLKHLMDEKQIQSLIPTLAKRYLNAKRIPESKQAYQALVDLIHADGYLVESYQLPLITEERRAHATVLQRIAGLIDINTDREVLMLYSSFIRPHGAAVLWSYAPQAESIAVGSTGGGVQLNGVKEMTPLTWDEFSRDLRLCVQCEKPVHIFSLEGCVEQGFLPKLTTFDWDKPVDLPGTVPQINALRTGITFVLWLLQRPWVLLITLASFVGLRLLFKPVRHSASDVDRP